MGENLVVETEADELIRLLSRIPEISMIEASKQLKVPEATIELLATFLEEEGIVSIQYKLTTPYLSLAKPSARNENVMKQAKEPMFNVPEIKEGDEAKDEDLAPPIPLNSGIQIDSSKNASLTEIETLVNNLSGTWTTEPDLLRKTGMILDLITKKLSLAPLSKRSSNLQREILTYTRIFDEIKQRYQMGEKTAARDSLGELIVGFKSIVGKINALDLVSKYAPMLPENSSVVMNKIRELSASQQFTEAEALYELLKEKATEFPRTFYEKEIQFDTDLSKLNQELFSAFETHKSDKFNLISKEMKKLLSSIPNDLKKNEIVIAEEKMRRLKIMLSELPESYPGQKAELESNVLKLSGDLLAQKGNFHTKTFLNKSMIIQHKIKELESCIQRRDIDRAPSIYNEIKMHFESLPDTFPDKKVELQSQILNAYQGLIKTYESFSEAKFASMERELLTLLAEMSVQLKLKQLDNAAELYHRVKKVFYSLPQGKIERKIQLHKKILDLFSVFKDRYPKSVREKFMKVDSLIKKEMEEAKKILHAGDLHSAWKVYYGMLKLFASLPPIGHEQRNSIRKEILAYYQALLIASDKLQMKNLDSAQNQAYDQLLSQIVKFHDLVHERKFNELDRCFSQITALFGELPMRVANSENKVKKEISVLGQEVEMYAKLQQALEAQKKGKKVGFNVFYRVLGNLRSENPADEELYRYVESVLPQRGFVPMPKPKEERPLLANTMKNLNVVAAQKDEPHDIMSKIQGLRNIAYATVQRPG